MLEFRHMQVVVIDDNPIDHFLATTLVRQINLEKEPVCLASVDEALAFLHHIESSAVQPMIILLDINMPEKNGFDFLEAFAAMPLWLRDACRVIMLSSSVSQPEIEKAQASPFVTRYLSKPLTVQKLVEVLEELAG
ncbi:MAG TPA: response regulator [Chitinophagaceae bacterium]